MVQDINSNRHFGCPALICARIVTDTRVRSRAARISVFMCLLRGIGQAYAKDRTVSHRASEHPMGAPQVRRMVDRPRVLMRALVAGLPATFSGRPAKWRHWTG